MSVKSGNNRNKRYKLVPPDGGWGYVVGFACILMMAPTGGLRSSFSLMYHDLMEEIGLASTKVGFVAGCNVMCLSLSGYLTGPLLKVMSLRQLALIATALFNLGAFFSAFTYSFTMFAICQSMLQNVGFGILYNLIFTCMRDYFSKKRLLAVSTVQTANAISSVCVPFVIKSATDVYGHRGMLIFVSCISMQAFVGVSLLQPVAWHMKKELLEEDGEERKKTVTKNDKKQEEKPLIKEKDEESDKTKEANTQFSFKLLIKGLIDVKMIKEFGMSRTCLGLSTVFVADFLYSLMITKALYARGMSREDVASSMSSIATGDLATRIAFIFFSEHLKKIGSKQLFAVGSFLAFLARSGVLILHSKTYIIVCLTVTGIARSFGTTLIPVIVADTIPPEDYTAGLGMTMLLIGVLNLLLGPITGAIRDYTGSYDIVLWSICFLFLAVTILFTVDIICSSKNSKKKKKE